MFIFLGFSPDGKPLSKNALKKLEKEKEKERKKAEREAKQVGKIPNSMTIIILLLSFSTGGL